MRRRRLSGEVHKRAERRDLGILLVFGRLGRNLILIEVLRDRPVAFSDAVSELA